MSPGVRQKIHLAVVLAATFFVVAAVIYFIVKDASDRIVEFQAVTVAEIVARDATSA